MEIATFERGGTLTMHTLKKVAICNSQRQKSGLKKQVNITKQTVYTASRFGRQPKPARAATI